MQIKNVRQVGKSEFFDVVMQSGTKISDCKIVEGKEGKFISGPARSYEKNGEVKWVNLVSFSKFDQEQIFKCLLGNPPENKPVYSDDFDDPNSIPF